MTDNTHQQLLQQVTRKLVFFTGGILLIVALAIYSLMALSGGEKPPILVLIVFLCGLLGGFVSIQQRLPAFDLPSLRALASSWLSITLIPINGGVFAMVMMFAFMGGILEGALFPTYGYHAITDTASFYSWIEDNYPTSNHGVAKLIFWAFVAGFSERLVPQVIGKVSTGLDKSTGDDAR